MFKDQVDTANGTGGPISIFSIMSGLYRTGVENHSETRTAFWISATVSLFLGTTNALPLIPLDGGNIARAFLAALNARVAKYFTVTAALLCVIFLVTAVVNDIRVLFR